ncbi:mitogen-activated protein kinase kinase kinase 3-like [Neltuma alba]|uniref:mitogen-activated protein kinase kinase kinase 3-like n=1 Tax=Neltuma alba TaxID=207710 RepID=UPI0010A5290B|nr:mitogen-activated protein kinase kinase kinase 3-like [Prosopis alba]
MLAQRKNDSSQKLSHSETTIGAAYLRNDLLRMTSTPTVPRSMPDEISPASIIKHHSGMAEKLEVVTDRSESILGLRESTVWGNCSHLKARLASFMKAPVAAKLVVVGGALVSLIALLLRRTIIGPQFRLYLGIRRPNINNAHWFASNKLLFIVLALFHLLISLAASQMPFFEWIMEAIILVELLLPVIRLLYLLLRPLFLYFFSRKEVNQDERGIPVETCCVMFASREEAISIDRVIQEDDSAVNSVSHTTNLSPWERVERIGAGGYGIVYVARHRDTGDLCAVKELNDIHKLPKVESFEKEIKILSQLEHPNIVKYCGNERIGRHIFLYMEYIQPGSLKNYILERGGLREPLIQKFTAQILSGLDYLCNKRVVHRDIKPDNLLVDSNNKVKLVDFGLAKHLAESVGQHSTPGTPYYAAPEVLKRIKYKSWLEASAADIWSLGCVIVEMFSGEHPWPDLEPVNASFKVCVKEEHPPIPEELSQEGKDFLQLCFQKTPADRPSAAALLDHPYVKAQTT